MGPGRNIRDPDNKNTPTLRSELRPRERGVVKKENRLALASRQERFGKSIGSRGKPEIQQSHGAGDESNPEDHCRGDLESDEIGRDQGASEKQACGLHSKPARGCARLEAFGRHEQNET